MQDVAVQIDSATTEAQNAAFPVVLHVASTRAEIDGLFRGALRYVLRIEGNGDNAVDSGDF